MTVREMAQRAHQSSILLGALGEAQKNAALLEIAKALEAARPRILEANRLDVESAGAQKLAAPLLKRLALDDKKLSDIIAGIVSLAALPDPVGRTTLHTQLDVGLELYRMTCPIGVIGVIFESRPDALVQISTLCLKSGNAALLKGGSEAINTNRALYDALLKASLGAGIPEGWLWLLATREDVGEMLREDQSIDLIIPRGSNEFVQHIMRNTNIPVMGHADGICHVYVDCAADLKKALDIAVDSKTQYVAVCNAAETLLVHGDVAQAFLPTAFEALRAKGVEVFGCGRTRGITPAEPADEDTYYREYLDYKLSVKIVDSLDEAIAHINEHGSSHTDAIVTEDKVRAARFVALVDSANAFVNCSTRFSDGFRYGFGAEVGISTGKLHARGPVGLEGLVSYKYALIGDGHIVEDYVSGSRAFEHKSMAGEYPL